MKRLKKGTRVLILRVPFAYVTWQVKEWRGTVIRQLGKNHAFAGDYIVSLDALVAKNLASQTAFTPREIRPLSALELLAET
jgi:hypothetical protein